MQVTLSPVAAGDEESVLRNAASAVQVPPPSTFTSVPGLAHICTWDWPTSAPGLAHICTWDWPTSAPGLAHICTWDWPASVKRRFVSAALQR